MAEILFKVDTKHRKEWFTGTSFSHPAKMSLPLQLWIIENYTKPGEVILDPMAGSGTVLVACSLGRNVIALELESKFTDIMKGNWEKIKQRGAQLGYTFGKAEIICGDARQLTSILCNVKQSNVIITSPPYAEAHNAKGLGVGDNDRADLRPYSYLKSGIKGQIGDLPYGEIDKCIFSPPFKEQMLDTDWMNKNFPRKHRGKHNPKEQEPENIGNLEYGNISSIITSPPYAEQVHKGSGEWSQSPNGKMVGVPQGEDYTKSEDNIANLKYGDIDAVVTSPPHEDTFGASRLGKKIRTGKSKIQQEKSLAGSYTVEQTNNIGNKQGQSYLEAMLQVYLQCFKVLRPQGLMILVTKNFIRNKQIIRLDTDTIKLCEQAGFKFLERHYRRLPSQSFWRVIYHQKHPEAEQILNEDVLVFKKVLL